MTLEVITVQETSDVIFVRKADPETKGKVEKNVNWIREEKNFLYNRNIRSGNPQCASLCRLHTNRAIAISINLTKKRPCRGVLT